MLMRLYVLQRVTAALMLPFILAHLALIFYATRSGLTAADVLGRTRFSISWAMFYGAFVLLASVHGVIGIRTVLAEWAGKRGRAADVAAAALGVLLLVLGLRAVAAVVFPGGTP